MVTSTFNIKLMSVGIKLMSDIDIKNFFQPKSFFNQNIFSTKIFFTQFLVQWSFSQHILDIILTSCANVHIVAILTWTTCQSQGYWHRANLWCPLEVGVPTGTIVLLLRYSLHFSHKTSPSMIRAIYGWIWFSCTNGFVSMV